jgi:hypothetical protein
MRRLWWLSAAPWQRRAAEKRQAADRQADRQALSAAYAVQECAASPVLAEHSTLAKNSCKKSKKQQQHRQQLCCVALPATVEQLADAEAAAAAVDRTTAAASTTLSGAPVEPVVCSAVKAAAETFCP